MLVTILTTESRTASASVNSIDIWKLQTICVNMLWFRLLAFSRPLVEGGVGVGIPRLQPTSRQSQGTGVYNIYVLPVPSSLWTHGSPQPVLSGNLLLKAALGQCPSVGKH